MGFEEMLKTHKDFVTIMPAFFGLLPETAKTIPLCFSPHQQHYKKGSFTCLERTEIVLILEDHHHPLDLLFTCIHESAHYLHFLARPEFYTKIEEWCRYPDNIGILNFREGVADIAAFEFLRIHGRLKEFIQIINSVNVNSINEILVNRPDELANYHIYKHFRASGKLDEIIKTKFHQYRRIRQYCDALYYLRSQLDPCDSYKPKRVPWAEIPADRLLNTIEICKEI